MVTLVNVKAVIGILGISISCLGLLAQSFFCEEVSVISDAPRIIFHDSMLRVYNVDCTEEVDWTVYIKDIVDDRDELSIKDVSINASSVDFSKQGSYKVYYSISDSDGFETTVSIEVNIID
jgi:hypothetical protein